MNLQSLSEFYYIILHKLTLFKYMLGHNAKTNVSIYCVLIVKFYYSHYAKCISFSV